MNATRKPIKVVQCQRCPDVYMMVENTPIGLAHPRPVTLHEGQPLQGVCPRHRQRGV